MKYLKDRLVVIFSQKNVRRFLESCFFSIFIYVFFFNSTENRILEMQFIGTLLEGQKEKNKAYPKELDEVLAKSKSELYEYEVKDISFTLVSKNMDFIKYESGIFSSNNLLTKTYLFLRNNFGFIASSSIQTILSLCLLISFISPRLNAPKVTKAKHKPQYKF